MEHFIRSCRAVSCGGGESDSTGLSCVTLAEDEDTKEWRWLQSHTLLYPRVNHSSWLSPSGIVLLGGAGEGSDTTELLNTDSTSSELFELEFDTV